MISSKYIKLNANVLMEYIFDNENYIQENYQVVENVKDSSRTFLSTINRNTLSSNFFTVDPILQRYSPINLEKFNFLQKQDFFTQSIPYDIVRIHFPIGFDFNTYLGFYLNIYAYSFENSEKYWLTNFFFDKTINYVSTSGYTYETPFLFDEQIWGKYIEIQIPSVDYVSNQRYVTNTVNLPIDNSINKNLTTGEGLSLTTPIFINFTFLTAKEVTFDVPYYSISDIFSTSIAKVPEFKSLTVNIEESNQGDFFDVYASYNGSNENIDEFIYEMQVKGRDVRFEYTVTLVEENIITNTLTFLVTDNFTNKIPYRPIITFSNTTAAIDVVLDVIDVVDNSTISRLTSIGLTNNIFKYGKRLSQINLGTNVMLPKIYNAKSLDSSSSGKNITQKVNIPTPVYYPVLNDRYLISVDSTLSTSEGVYQGMGKLNILITPFDNIIEFRVASNVNTNDNTPTPYDLSTLTNNGQILLVFQSLTDKIKKEIFTQASTNSLSTGVIVFKLEQIDIPLLRKISLSSKNFFLVLDGGKSQTMLYQGTFSFSENAIFK